ncbi:hypothetical protein [Chryseobacterium jejuense]|uniref:hypothetical protein n=1 Tax=Chryseobacterium jejuense TaxID=445960 RepID=UPI001AEB088F|nr:hypothetical protein [Chryseobacterium jejuense]MBP2617989.1 hypothetical protein [Chryseobacterium jejuense]
MKNLILCIVVSVCSFCKAQIGSDKDWAIIGAILCTRIEATSMGNKAFLSIGPKIPINENNYVSLRGHFNWWDLHGRKFIVIPELDYFRKIASFEKYNPIVTSLYTGSGVSPYTISPKFGVTFYKFFTAEMGYNWEFEKYKHFPMKGFRFSIGANFVF